MDVLNLDSIIHHVILSIAYLGFFQGGGYTIFNRHSVYTLFSPYYIHVVPITIQIIVLSPIRHNKKIPSLTIVKPINAPLWI